MALNENTDPEVLDKLVLSTNFAVRTNVLKNSNTSNETLRKWYQTSVINDTLTKNTLLLALQHNLKLSHTEISALIATYGSEVADYVANHIKVAPNSILQKQLNDLGHACPKNISPHVVCSFEL